MPCDTIRTNSVELTAVNKDLLVKGLAAAGFQAVERTGEVVRAYDPQTNQVFVVAGGQVRLRAGTEALADRVKRAYSAEAIREAARRVRWQQEEIDATHFRVVRRAV